MDGLTNIQILDRVLKFFATTTVEPLHFSVISNLFNSELVLDEGFMVSEKELQTIINKLVKDGYVIHQFAHTDAGIDVYMYRITFEGQFLYDNGGYDKKIKLQNSSLKSARIINGTIAITGSIVALFYLLETIKHYIMPLFQCR